MEKYITLDKLNKLDLSEAPLHIRIGYEWVQLEVVKLESERYIVFWCQKRLNKQALMSVDDHSVEEFYRLHGETYDLSMDKLIEGILIVINLYFFESNGQIDWSIFLK